MQSRTTDAELNWRDPALIKSMATPESCERLIQECAALGIEVSEAQSKELIRYLELVLIKNCSLNLTAIREWDKALILHLVDSLTFLHEFDDQPEHIQDMPFLDMGCGAGFPGIPLALMRPLRSGELCDSVKKKITAVNGFIEELGLINQLSTTSERLEVYARYHKHEFGCITARAVSSLPVLLEYAAPFLPRDGRLIVSKGQPTSDELESGDAAAKVCGFKLYSTRVVELPHDMGQRTMMVYRKAQEPSYKLPRAVGMAAKEPLA